MSIRGCLKFSRLASTSYYNLRKTLSKTSGVNPHTLQGPHTTQSCTRRRITE